jgi:hypothetical protein
MWIVFASTRMQALSSSPYKCVPLCCRFSLFRICLKIGTVILQFLLFHVENHLYIAYVRPSVLWLGYDRGIKCSNWIELVILSRILHTEWFGSVLMHMVGIPECLILGLFNGIVSAAQVIKWWAISGFILSLLNDTASTAQYTVYSISFPQQSELKMSMYNTVRQCNRLSLFLPLSLLTQHVSALDDHLQMS